VEEEVQMRVNFTLSFSFCVLATLSFVARVPFAQAQGRINDKDLENLMRNVRDDAKSFRPVFESAIRKSPIRKTSREKDAKNLVARFQKQTDVMLNNFKQHRKGDADLAGVMSSAQQIDRLVSDLRLAPPTSSSWEKIQAELQQVSSAFGLSTAEHYPRPVTATSDTPSCTQAVGAGREKTLVDECLAVSPATNPPCNAQNSCILIIDEIKRGCALLKQGVPAYCSEYK
jgi:hypothetical protein